MSIAKLSAKHKHWRSKPPSRGFTLTEMLTVVAISTILLGILVPVLAKAKYAAKNSIEISQLHQIGLAQAIYSEDSEHVATLDNLVAMNLVPRELCVSPNDMTRRGIANELVKVFAAHSELYEKVGLPYPSTYVGFREYQYPESWYEEYVNVNPNPGWLVSLTPTDLERPNDWGSMFSGSYRRLLFDASVVVRRHSSLATSEGRAQHPLLMFSDGDDEWKEKLISTSP